MTSATDLVKELGNGLYAPPLGSGLDALASPALLLDLNSLNRNIARMASMFAGGKVAVRPHMKTGKCTKIAKILRDAGFKGLCVTKVSEADVLLRAGIDDILITSPIGHPVTAAWLVRLLAPGRTIRVVIDSKESADVLSDALRSQNVPSLEVLLDVNVGQNRTGVAQENAVVIARYIADKNNLKLVGCQGYEGHLQMMRNGEDKKQRSRQAMTILTNVAKALRTEGHDIRIVTTGGTGTCTLCAEVDGVTEVQPGSFIFMDCSYIAAIGAENFHHALSILSTVISRPAPDKATIDAGWKSLSIDSGPARPANTSWTYQSAGDEHGYITGPGVNDLKVGDRVVLLPSHIDTTVSLHEVFYVMKEGKLVDVWPLEGRGRVQ